MSLDRVPGVGALYIGGLISMRRYQALRDAHITHVVTALRQPLDPAVYAAYRHLIVELDDLDDEDILQYFAASNAFIRDGLAAGGGVLIHCAMGKSRSATLVLAYMLSQQPDLTPTEALAQLRTVRSIVEPNPGFMRQLELYHIMGCPVDIDAEPQYQRWLYQRQVELSVATGRAPQTIRFEDENPQSTTNHTIQAHQASSMEARCRKCRQRLATSTFIIPHDPGKSPQSDAARSDTSQLNAQSRVAPLNTAPSNSSPPSRCAHLFVDPLSWMRTELERGELEGRLECPNGRCGANVGRYAWQGLRCSCGAWVVPGLSLTRSRIDEVPLRVGTGRPGEKI